MVSATLENGGCVHIASSNPKNVADKISKFKAAYPEASITGTAVDLSDETTLEENVKHILEEAVRSLGGPIDHLVDTAGDEIEGKPLSEVDPKTYFQGWNVRYLGPLTFAKTISGSPGTYLKVDAASSITLTSCGLAEKPVPSSAHIIGWAAAIEAPGKGLAVDMAPVRINVVAPGALDDKMRNAMAEAGGQRLGEGAVKESAPTASDRAKAYFFSMQWSFMNGEVIKG